MKILIDHALPFAFAHGGYQTQIEMTRLALERAGVEVDWLRWWDDRQRADLVHCFAPMDLGYLHLARQKRIPTVLTTLLNSECNHSAARLRVKRWKVALLPRIPGLGGIAGLLPWESFHLCAMNVVSLDSERRILHDVYRVPMDHVTQVPYGMSDAYLQAPPATRAGAYLISTGTITPRKRSVELARLAHRARTPVLFVGKPYREDGYWREFASLIDDEWVRYRPHVANETEMIALYREARGFVLASATENWCLSAHEAAACGLPVLLRRQPWATERFGDQAHYLADQPSADVEILRRFGQEAPTLPAPQVRQWSWWEVGEQLAALYRRMAAE